MRRALGARQWANSRDVPERCPCATGRSRLKRDQFQRTCGFWRGEVAGGPVAADAQRHCQDHAEEKKNEESGTDGWAGHCPARYNIPVVVSTTVAVYVPAF
jgi:hypothetical protein